MGDFFRTLNLLQVAMPTHDGMRVKDVAYGREAIDFK
jgi:hypothetical protein